MAFRPSGRLDATLDRKSGSTQAPSPAGGSRDPLLARRVPETIDVALIREAAKQIAITTCVLTDRAVVEALRGASGRGVKVQIWCEASEATRLSELDVEPRLGRPQPAFTG